MFLKPVRNGLLFVCLMSALASAQDFRAQVSGQVTDKTGAAIPGAKVTAIQKSTNQRSSQVTNQDGFYTLTALIPADYEIEVEASGFKREKKVGLTLLDSDKLILPFQLEV